MLFALGYICGVVTCGFIFAVIAAFRVDRIAEEVAVLIRRGARELNARVPFNLPVGQGFVFTPPDEDEEARQEIIEENAAAGRDTPISELRS